MSDTLPETAMGRCSACGSWWLLSVRKCGCGGELVAVDMDKHVASLERKAYDLTKDKDKK